MYLDQRLLVDAFLQNPEKERQYHLSRLSDFIMTKFDSLVADCAKKGDWVSWHREESAACFQELKSSTCCLVCLACPPQHVLRCGHAVCDWCVRRIGTPHRWKAYHYIVKTCVICRAPAELSVMLKPPTAGVRVLSVDGGGVRGVVPLRFLELIQTALGPNGQVSDYFDFAMGTSAGMWDSSWSSIQTSAKHLLGGLIVLGMFAKGWNATECTQVFTTFATKIFGTCPARQGSKVVWAAKTAIQLLRHDGMYSARVVNNALENALGSERRLFDHPCTGMSRHKFAVTTVEAEDVATEVFASYNTPNAGEATAQDHNDVCEYPLAVYRTSTRDDRQGEPLLWQV